MIASLYFMTAEIVSVIEFILFATILLGSFRFLGAIGLYVFTALAVVVGNIQVLLETKYFFQSDSVALGTIIFSTTFIATDLLVEHYGKKMAKMNVFIGFFAQLFIVSSMLLTLKYTPSNMETYNALDMLFSPTPRILFASLVAYVVSQLLDIHIFSIFRRKSSSLKLLWVRSNVSTLLSVFLDNCVFSFLAWYLLAPDPCTFNRLVFTYILGTYWFRIIISIWATPIMYLSYKCKKDPLIFDLQGQPMRTPVMASLQRPMER